MDETQPSKRIALNLSIEEGVIKAAKHWAFSKKRNRESVSGLVERLLRRELKGKGYEV